MTITGMSHKQGQDRAMAALRAQERGPRVFDTSSVQRMLDAHEQARTRVSTKLAGKLDTASRDAYQREIFRALGEITAAWQDAQAIENDASLYDKVKREQIDARLTVADATIREAIANARGITDVIRAEATVQAMPRMPDDPASQDRARQDALMILDRTPADKRTDKIAELAQRGDAIGALVTSQWGRDYAGAVLDSATAADNAHTLAVQRAIDAGRTSKDPERAKAAEAVRELGELAGIADTVAVPWNHAREVLTSHDGSGRAGMG